ASSTSPAARPGGAEGRTEPREEQPATARSPLLSEVTKLEQAFEAAIAARKAGDAAEAVLTLDRSILEWSADTLQTGEPDRARARGRRRGPRRGRSASGTNSERARAAPVPRRGRRAALRGGRASSDLDPGRQPLARWCRVARGDAVFHPRREKSRDVEKAAGH